MPSNCRAASLLNILQYRFATYYTGAAMNTARSFGPAVVTGFPYRSHWVVRSANFCNFDIAAALFVVLGWPSPRIISRSSVIRYNQTASHITSSCSCLTYWRCAVFAIGLLTPTKIRMTRRNLLQIQLSLRRLSSTRSISKMTRPPRCARPRRWLILHRSKNSMKLAAFLNGSLSVAKRTFDSSYL